MINKHDIKTAIKEVLDEEIKPFYIEKEQHYNDHSFLRELIKFAESIKDAFWKTLVTVITLFFLTACTGGILLWFKYHDKIPPVHKP